MNHLKKLGLTCLLVIAALMVAGAGTAAAEQSVFCKATQTPCEAGNKYAQGTKVVLSSVGTISWVTASGGEPTIEFACTGAELEGKTTTAGSSSQTVEVDFTSQTLSGCAYGQSFCSYTASQAPEMSFDWTSGTMNATVSAQALEYVFDCQSIGLKCGYKGTNKVGITLTGGNPAILTFKEASIPKSVGGIFFCGSEALMSGEFEITTPSPLYVSNG